MVGQSYNGKSIKRGIKQSIAQRLLHFDVLLMSHSDTFGLASGENARQVTASLDHQERVVHLKRRPPGEILMCSKFWNSGTPSPDSTKKSAVREQLAFLAICLCPNCLALKTS